MERSEFNEIILSSPLEFPQQFYLMNKYKPSDSLSIVIDQMEEDFITIREIEQRLVERIGPIQITDAYVSLNINPDEVFSYFKGLLPLYFIPKTNVQLKFDASFKSDPSAMPLEDVMVALPNKIDGAWLFKEISDKIKIESNKFYLMLRQGYKFRKLSRNNSDILLEFQEGDFLLVKPLKHGSTSLVLKLTSLNEISVKFGEQTTVEELKEIIDIHHKIPSDKIKLIFKGDTFSDDIVLKKAGVEEGSKMTLFRVTKPLPEVGGNFNFVDPTKAKQKTIQFARSAPEWRLARYGLCLEGICKTKECRAIGEYVIMNKSFGILDVVLDRLSNKCPICKQIVEFDTCGFNNCSYQFLGVKFENGAKVNVSTRGKVGNEYLRFDPSEDGKVDWATLKIITRKIDDLGENCQICLQAVASDAAYKLPCEHKLHTRCRNPNIICVVCSSNNNSNNM